MAAYSTSREILKSKKTLPANLKDQVLGNPAKFSRRTDEAYEIYQPLVVSDKCLECHDDLKKGAVGGVALLRLSTDTLAKSKQSWNVATVEYPAHQYQSGHFHHTGYCLDLCRPRLVDRETPRHRAAWQNYQSSPARR